MAAPERPELGHRRRRDRLDEPFAHCLGGQLKRAPPRQRDVAPLGRLAGQGLDPRHHPTAEASRPPRSVAILQAGLPLLTEALPPLHPHVRGEGARHAVRGRPTPGSPPRAWGRGGRCAVDLDGLRFTPTCVGKGSGGSIAPSNRFGSPPRAWGRDDADSLRINRTGFTPTCVGKGPCRSGPPSPSTVHPHVRGEGQMFAHDPVTGGGSPPRTWGRGPGLDPRRHERRFTPTCVGKGARRRQACSTRRVHPHVRGEGGLLTALLEEDVGSPPRAWGRVRL